MRPPPMRRCERHGEAWGFDPAYLFEPLAVAVKQTVHLENRPNCHFVVSPCFVAESRQKMIAVRLR
jgi:hypothetical protein